MRSEAPAIVTATRLPMNWEMEQEQERGVAPAVTSACLHLAAHYGWRSAWG